MLLNYYYLDNFFIRRNDYEVDNYENCFIVRKFFETKEINFIIIMLRTKEKY